jgi:hypothetical protein
MQKEHYMDNAKREAFERAKQERKQQKEKESSRGQGGGYSPDYEEIHWTSLHGTDSSSDKVVRFIGSFPTSSQDLRVSTDSKFLPFSQIVGDDDKKFFCKWPTREQTFGPDSKPWILYRIYDLVMEVEWINHPDRNNERIYKNESAHSSIFQRVAKNSSDNKYETGWKPKDLLIANVIDRHDMEWHRDHKHSKLLSKSSTERNDGGFWYDFGVPKYLYDVVFDSVVENGGYWDEYDIAIRRSKDRPWYFAFHGEKDDWRIKDDKSKSFIRKGSLTEEELSWELYDIDKITKVTSFQKIKKKLGVFIQQVDKAFGKKFFDELEELVRLEKEEYEENEVNSSSSTPIENNPIKEEEVPEPPVVEEKPQESSRRSRGSSDQSSGIQWNELANGSFNGYVYKGVSKMTQEEKDLVESINEDGTFKYKKDNLELFPTESTIATSESQVSREKGTILGGFLTPDPEYHICPLSGEIF